MTTFNETAHSLFLEAWNNVPKVEYKTEWENGTGYLDHVTDDSSLDLKKDQFVGTTDTTLNRKVLIKGLGGGLNMVVFERNTKGLKGILVSNTPSGRKLKDFVLDFPKGAFSTSLNINTVKAFLNEQEHTVRFYTEVIDTILKEMNPNTLVSVGSQLIKDIEEEKDISVNHLKQIGIDVNMFKIYLHISQYN